MEGCPVDSIHRGKHLQIVIEDHCIGCGLCAENCPYGSIFMIPNERNPVLAPDPEHEAKTYWVGQGARLTAISWRRGRRSLLSPHPACVAACPHDAAFRMTGPQLLERVMGTHAEDLASAGFFELPMTA